MGWKLMLINIKYKIVAVKYRIFSRFTKFCARALYNVGLQHHPNTNHVERLHGSIREREKTMSGLKIEDSNKFAVKSDVNNIQGCFSEYLHSHRTRIRTGGFRPGIS